MSSRRDVRRPRPPTSPTGTPGAATSRPPPASVAPRGGGVAPGAGPCPISLRPATSADGGRSASRGRSGEALLLAPLLFAIFARRPLPYRLARSLALLLLSIVTAVLVASLALWVAQLPTIKTGPHLLFDGAVLWAINVLVFAVWYWEVDGGGPLNRLRRPHAAADLLFPQQQGGNPTRWAPGFVDYLFVAFCFSTALSPADTAPLTRGAKLLMMAQAALSLAIIVLLIGRSVNILS